MLILKNVLKPTEKMETSTRKISDNLDTKRMILKTDGNMASDKLDRFVVSEKFDLNLSLSLTDLRKNVAKVQCHFVGQECEFDNVGQSGICLDADGSADMNLGDKDSVSVQRMGFGASMGDKGCVVLKCLTNVI